ncbi:MULTISPECIES: nucleotide exchange factor GrpE [Mesorhizobium]|uniref:Protein GrpE n=1 Tax=Mesorhizobium shonense TaxID=1209948 RepID=A0ABV2HYI9_9HYPH|nr:MULTISPECIES: nucleotide exchange factor GrpE [unclassified Mesorhizobium]AZO27869.1 nucleotide exchange factor GrpE [Mesorhizobium sp. M1B.F.Ca.ET.045.04.1.1]RWA67706.1 MAG: nucleotide exchange factor GrpE [Mesorhizobium sp.]RWA85028.1 MAG: nucleotide exchange factor GrpE [Mesorhizobium sp.]RWB23624.1 MAG: nucleotide exchange factor GrpE [Mesorhizobium sp.]RWD99515.1 MAG: nucleotide exchange factor GrpE [Mesorhizobium sp.]
MSDQAKDERAPEEIEATQASDAQASGAQASGERAEGGVDGDYEALVRLLKENEELKDRALRVAAEMENLRRRTARDVHDARTYAVANFARDMLSVSDNLRRALDAIPAEAKAAGDAGFKALIEGVDLTERAMLSALERHGVKKLAPEGEKFDPNFHQAMFEVPNADVAAGTVVQVVQPGYSIGERVLRPAMVGVAKGGPKAASEAKVEPGPVNEQAEKDA